MSIANATRRDAKVPARLGRYDLLTSIASGGMASVHLGRMQGKAGFSRTVAVKVLHRHLAEDPEFVGMFLDEARLAARIRHPHVVDVYDVESIGKELIIVMEYIEGASLQALQRAARAQNRELPRGFVLRVLHEMLQGLHAAHCLVDERGEPIGVIHRDISPHNILVGVDGVTRVTDFGIAKAKGRSTSTRTGVVKGKLHYVAPEQLKSQPLDRRVDVFAAGVVLWECLTDRPLFKGEDEAATMMMVLQKPIPPPSTYAAGVSIALDRVCLRALERDPDRRFPSALAFAEALEQAAGDTFFRAREIGELVEILQHQALESRREALSVRPARRSSSNELDLAEEPTRRLEPAADRKFDDISGIVSRDDTVSESIDSNTGSDASSEVPRAGGRRRKRSRFARTAAIAACIVPISALGGWFAARAGYDTRVETKASPEARQPQAVSIAAPTEVRPAEAIEEPVPAASGTSGGASADAPPMPTAASTAIATPPPTPSARSSPRRSRPRSVEMAPPRSKATTQPSAPFMPPDL